MGSRDAGAPARHSHAGAWEREGPPRGSGFSRDEAMAVGAVGSRLKPLPPGLGRSGSHAPAWEPARALRVHGQPGRRSARTAFPRGSVGTRRPSPWERLRPRRGHGGWRGRVAAEAAPTGARAVWLPRSRVGASAGAPRPAPGLGRGAPARQRISLTETRRHKERQIRISVSLCLRERFSLLVQTEDAECNSAIPGGTAAGGANATGTGPVYPWLRGYSGRRGFQEVKI